MRGVRLIVDEQFEMLENLFQLTIPADLRLRTIRYLDLLEKWASKMNLTTCLERQEALRHHFLESFWAAEHFVGDHTRIADVGTGAGFPGLPIKLYKPGVQLVLIEKNYKKAVFLKEACRALSVTAQIEVGPAESFAGWHRVDMVALRALRPTPELLQEIRVHGLQLLLLHGLGPPIDEAPFVCLERRKVPGSTNRYAALYEPSSRPRRP